MAKTSKPVVSAWTPAPSMKLKNAVHRAVTALLDELAPERVIKRGEQLRLPIEQHRTPSGCVLQAATAAVSVSWFVEPGEDAPLGELHIVVWKGKVTRRGAPPAPEGATVVKELVLQPVVQESEETMWKPAKGREFTTTQLAERCIQLLEEQIRSSR